MGSLSDVKATCVARSIPDGAMVFEFEFPYKNAHFLDIILSRDDKYFICYGLENYKNAIYVFQVADGSLMHTILVKYPNFKEITFMCGLPDKPWQVALIDQDKGNIMDVVDKRFTIYILQKKKKYPVKSKHIFCFKIQI